MEIWISEGLRIHAQVIRVAEGEMVNEDEREALRLKLDGRMTSLERTLQMVRYNLVNEYPRMIRLDDPFSMLVVQSSNMNDQYRLDQFLQDGVIASAALRDALAALHAHLLALPPIERPSVSQPSP